MSIENITQAVRNLQEQLLHTLESVNASINDLLFVLESQEPDISQSDNKPQAERESATNSIPKLSLTQPLSNKSKFLNDEQRKKVIEYITNPDE